MKHTTATLLAACLLALAACQPEEAGFDASGAFEAVETIISAEVPGVIRALDVEEGQRLDAGREIGHIDCNQTLLRKKQVEAQIQAVLGKKPDVAVQLASLRTQLAAAEREKARLTRLVAGDAAPQKQLDDVEAQIATLQAQMDAQRSSLEIASTGLAKEAVPLHVQLEQLDDQLGRCRIVNPVAGTVIARYAQPHEMAQAGRPLYKIADLSTMTLRAYVSGGQLPQIKLGQTVEVLTDDGHGGHQSAQGTISWISDKAEFTPKTVQTKDQRANMVYAVKVKVPNDGRYKIGMYGELKF